MLVTMEPANRTTDAGRMHDADRDSVDSAGSSDLGAAASPTDRAVVAAQIGREPRATASVAARCPFGFPAVTHQAPNDDEGRPFPTAYYVTCPHLVRQIDRVEAAGGVRRFEAAIASDASLRESTSIAHERHARVDGRGSRIAASTDPDHLKCLHAHAGFELALGGHPLGAEVLREAAPRWCDDARCVALVPTGA